MNPYALHLGDRDPLQVLSNTPKRLAKLLETIGPVLAQQPRAPGKWSVHQIICHLADCEIAFGFRLRQALAEDRHVIQPFDQEKWANVYTAYETQQALMVFLTGRSWNIILIEATPRRALSKPVLHPERGEMTFRTLIETMAGHDLNHLGQVEAIASRGAVRH